VRWILQAGGAQTDRDKGVEDLRLTAERGLYLSPYARLLLAVAALRSNDLPARAICLRHWRWNSLATGYTPRSWLNSIKRILPPVSCLPSPEF